MTGCSRVCVMVFPYACAPCATARASRSASRHQRRTGQPTRAAAGAGRPCRTKAGVGSVGALYSARRRGVVLDLVIDLQPVALRVRDDNPTVPLIEDHGCGIGEAPFA